MTENFATDPLLHMEVTVQIIQPYMALKRYLCPGCGHDIETGIGHVVAVPNEAPDLRRHWHKRCWARAVANYKAR